MAGGSAAAIPFKNELDFLRQSVFRLSNQGGFYHAAGETEFWQLWLKHGGWWLPLACLYPPVQVGSLERSYAASSATLAGETGDYPFHLLFYPTTVSDPKGFQNLSGLGELNSEVWVELHPQTAQALGLLNGSPVKLTSPVGQIHARVRLNAQLASDVLAIPWAVTGQVVGGPEAGCNPLDLVGTEQNSSGNLAFAGLRVRIEPFRA
jgi:anaerobic selenocysteine-containing dehydrogenase